MKDFYYAVFGGYGPQNWMNYRIPDIEGKCDGLTIMKINSDDASAVKVCEVHDIISPSMLAITENHKFIYSTNETHEFEFHGSGGGITSYKFNSEEGTLEKLNDSLAYGSSSAYVSLDSTEKYIFVANHGTKFYNTRFEKTDDGYKPIVQRDEGVVCVFRLNEDGSIGRCTDRFVLDGTGFDEYEHASAHPHCVIIDKQDFVIIPNKGGDSIWVGKFNRDTERIDALSVFYRGLGSSPRHAVFVPDTDYVLVINEYNGHLGSYKLNRENGVLSEISYIDSADPDYNDSSPLLGVESSHPWACDVQIHPNRRFVYTNGAQPNITQFEFDVNTGTLKTVRYYHDIKGWMRGMRITPDGKYLFVTGVINEKCFVYRIDDKTGALSKHSEIPLPTPTSVNFIEV